jgi:hypothetical protein
MDKKVRITNRAATNKGLDDNSNQIGDMIKIHYRDTSLSSFCI